MARLYPTRGAQPVMSSEFVFSFNDTAADSVSGVVKTFGSVFGDVIVFDCIPLPPGAQVVGGDLVVETAGVGPTVYTAALGVAGNTACYLAATSLLSAANTRTALLLTTALASNTGLNVRLTINSTVANASAGKFRVTIQWKMDGRQTDATPS
jgi:hypothetical protein